MIAISGLNRRITVQRASYTPNAFGEREPVWTDLITLWAKRTDVSDGEKRATAHVSSLLLSRFVVRRSAAARQFSARDRILHEGAIWNIIGIKEVSSAPQDYLEIMAARDEPGVSED